MAIFGPKITKNLKNKKTKRQKPSKILVISECLKVVEKFEQKLDQYEGDLKRAVVELAKEWRTDKMLRQLEAMLIVMDLSIQRLEKT